jgi:hypothetical protein
MSEHAGVLVIAPVLTSSAELAATPGAHPARAVVLPVRARARASVGLARAAGIQGLDGGAAEVG